MTRHHDIPAQIKATFQEVSGSPDRHKRKDTLPPFSLRLSFEERSRLEKEAGDLPLGTYIRDKLFDGAPTKRRLRKQPVKELNGQRNDRPSKVSSNKASAILCKYFISLLSQWFQKMCTCR
jgi:hypothetical protein